jgi:hypothetical protein
VPEQSGESLADFVDRTFAGASVSIKEPARIALERLLALATTAAARRLAVPWGYYQGVLRDRIGDVLTLASRLLAAQRELVDSHVARGSGESRGTMDWREIALPQQMRLDFEALYIFGNLALDHWAMLGATLTGDCEMPVQSYQDLFSTLQGSRMLGCCDRFGSGTPAT